MIHARKDINELQRIFRDLKQKGTHSYWYERALSMLIGWEQQEDDTTTTIVMSEKSPV